MISEKHIMKKLKEYAKTDAGRAAIKKKYGIDYSERINLEPYRAYGRQMKSILLEYIGGIIHSITEKDILVGEPNIDKKGNISLTISFHEGSLQRPSLYKKGYPDGVENIVLLFTHGYHAKNYVYGKWSYKRFSTHKPIRSRKDRKPNDFLQRAVEEFNRFAKGHAIAVLNNIYQ